MIPGEVVAADGTIELNPGRERCRLVVENTGDRPIQVGSHFHFADVNAALAITGLWTDFEHAMMPYSILCSKLVGSPR